MRSPSSSEASPLRGWWPSRRLSLVVAGLACLLGSAGCGHLGVKAHQREWLADRIMRLDGNLQEQAADEHILANREGAIGGSGTSGGGCGCN